MSATASSERGAASAAGQGGFSPPGQSPAPPLGDNTPSFSVIPRTGNLLSDPAPSHLPSSRPEAQSAGAERPLYPADPATGVSSTPHQAASACEAAFCLANHTETEEPVLPAAQRRWAARPLVERLQTVRKARHWIAANAGVFAKAISLDLARTEADTLVTELLPLLEAMRFLERYAGKLLAPRKLGNTGRPFWLTGVHSEIHRDPLGHILVIGPANFPLFLPGVQAVQALVAGNAVTWKPGTGGQKVAMLLEHALREAGLPRGVLHITDESVQAAESALAHHPDKVIFTGSFDTGTRILSTLARTATPATMELSGADAVIVLPSADLALAAKAVAFGLRLNGAEVCMSPRRLVATRETLKALRPLLQAELAKIPPVQASARIADTLTRLLAEALAAGASQVNTSPLVAQQNADPAELLHPILIDHATPDMAINRTDLFAPVLSLIEAPSVLHMADLVNDNPYALTAAIFGAPREAETLATQLRVGTVLINDLIAPTADPRVPFGGLRHSGFGTTRGAEGLLEMTSAKTVLIRRKGTTRHYDPLGPGDLPLFTGLIGALHGGSAGERWRSLKQVITAGRNRRSPPKPSS